MYIFCTEVEMESPGKKRNRIYVDMIFSASSIPSRFLAAKCLDIGYGVGEQLRIFTFWSPPKSHRTQSDSSKSQHQRLTWRSDSPREFVVFLRWIVEFENVFRPLFRLSIAPRDAEFIQKMYLKKSQDVLLKKSWGPIPNWRFGSKQTESSLGFLVNSGNEHISIWRAASHSIPAPSEIFCKPKNFMVIFFRVETPSHKHQSSTLPPAQHRCGGSPGKVTTKEPEGMAQYDHPRLSYVARTPRTTRQNHRLRCCTKLCSRIHQALLDFAAPTRLSHRNFLKPEKCKYTPCN